MMHLPAHVKYCFNYSGLFCPDFYCSKLFNIMVLGLLVLVMNTAKAQSQPIQVSLKSGEVRVLHLKGVSQVAIGNPEVVSYKTLENGQVMLIGLESGGSSLHVWKNGGREEKFWINVEQRYVSEDVRLARLLTKNINALKIYSMDSRLVVEGRIDEEQAVVVEAIRNVVPDALFILTKRSFAVKPLVRVDAVLVEIGSNDMKKLGIDWSDSISGPSFGFHKTSTAETFRLYQEDASDTNAGIISNVPLNDNSFYQYFGITSHIMSTIELLENSGKARVLSSPKLTSVSGKPATFHVGGSFPIPVINAVGAATIEREDYGVILEVLPTVEQDDINLEVLVELSDIDNSVVVNGVPGTKTRSTETVVQLQHNQTVAIAGLFSTGDSNSSSGVPYLSKLPVLEYLFGVKESDIEDRQVVVLLTPKIITPGDEADRAMSDFSRDMLTEYKSKLTIDAALME